jgi:hypothetical protein
MSRVWISGLVQLLIILIFVAPIPGASSTNAHFESEQIRSHIKALKKKVPEGFTMIVQPPFVILGDEPARKVHERATNTIQRTVTMLKAQYFKDDPAEIIDIWLFKDGESYTNHVKLLFNDVPGTRFGYYSPADKALVMNISTGTGTLVHEIVHPFIERNFPGCPAWFNEGLASLYEAATIKDGRLRGLLNWRFKDLEKAIKEGRTISFKDLTAKTGREFYQNAAGYNQHYAQARYLCFYLQEKDLLTKYYTEFVANAGKDPTGYKTLQRVLGEKDMESFQKKWEKFILKLRTP